MRLSSLFSPASLLAVLVVLVLASVADAGIFRKRRCGTSRPAASSCASGSCSTASPAGYGSHTYGPASGSAVYSSGGCPGGVCPAQR